MYLTEALHRDNNGINSNKIFAVLSTRLFATQTEKKKKRKNITNTKAYRATAANSS